MLVDMCVGMCVDTCADMWADMCVDMCKGMCIHTEEKEAGHEHDSKDNLPPPRAKRKLSDIRDPSADLVAMDTVRRVHTVGTVRTGK